MIGLLIAILILVALGQVVTVISGVALARNMISAISRQDDRVRKRLERQVQNSDEEDIGQLVDDLRRGGTDLGAGDANAVADVLLARHPDAKWPSDL